MALVLKNRVLETCTAPGTGAVTLLGAVTGYQTFSSAIGNANTCYYTIADQNGANWEVGIGTYTSSGNTLTRTTVLSSSNGGATTNFTSGTQNVFVTYPSERSVNLSSSALTSGRVTYATTDGLLTDSANMTFNGTTLTLANDASISGFTVGYGAGGGFYQNAVFGVNALGASTTGAYNTAIGISALRFNTTASDNTAVGYQSLYSQSTGGAENTAVGYQAGYSNTGQTLCAVGSGAAYSNTTGADNTAIGSYRPLYSNTTGSYNVAIGRQALYSNTTASNNTAVGYQSLYTNTTGARLTAIGLQTGYANTASDNTFLGTYSGYTNTTGTYNLFAGYQDAGGYGAGHLNTTGSYNVALGGGALRTNTTGSASVAIGYQAANTATGGNTIAIGYQAGASITSGTQNIAIGIQTMLNANVTGSYNIGIGTQSLATVSSGANNVGIGYFSLYSNTTASNNTAVGYQAGYSNTTGANTVSIGYQAGYTTTTGGSNIFIGGGSSANAAGDSNTIVIGQGATGKGGGTGFISPSGGNMYQGNNSTLWSVTSDQRLKKNIVDNNIGLDKITQIQVRNFEYRLPEEITDVDSKQAINKTGIQLGAIAQELQQVLPECVKQESTGIYTVDADPLIWYLINAVKELKAEIDQLKGA